MALLQLHLYMEREMIMNTSGGRKCLFCVGMAALLCLLVPSLLEQPDDALSNVWGAACGPCVAGDECGLGNSPDPVSDCAPNYCNDECTTTCAKGDDDKFCVGTGSGNCTITMTVCNYYVRYHCALPMFGGGCGCDSYSSGSYCSRQLC